jgi:2-(1,2-epoxy-1,2-dihydrophenyl)acetyl-CoA isomerase
MSDFKTIDFSVSHSIARITLNRPEAANGLNDVMALELAEAALKCDSDSGVKAVVLTGAGFSMAIAGDLVVASRSAAFTMAYTRAGLSPDGSSSYYLPRLVGLRKAQELMFTNRSLSADEALAWGLINFAVADDALADKANELAEKFACGPRKANATVKKLLLSTYSNGLEVQMEIEGRCIAECAESKDGVEGIAAFISKRSPNFE